MTIAVKDKWAISGITSATAIIVLNPLLFYGINWLIKKGAKKDVNVWTVEGGYIPTVYAFFVHVVGFFFLTYMFLAVINWKCSF